MSIINSVLRNPYPQHHKSTKFDGVNDYLRDNPFFGIWNDNNGSLERTYSGWAKLNTTGNNTRRCLWHNLDPRKRVGPFNNRGIILSHFRYAGGTDEVLEFWVRTDGGTASYDTEISLASSGIVIGEWFHYCISYDPYGGPVLSFKPRVTWYINGRQITHTTIRDSVTIFQDISSTTGWHWGAQHINETIGNLTWANHFNGWQAYFLVHRNKTSQAGASWLFNNGLPQQAQSRHLISNEICNFNFAQIDSSLGFPTMNPTKDSNRGYAGVNSFIQPVGALVVGNSDDLPGGWI